MKKLLLSMLMALMLSISAFAETITVTYDSNEGMYYGTLADNSVLYFYRSSYYNENGNYTYYYCVEEIATANSSITLPDTVVYQGNSYRVGLGYSSYNIVVTDAPDLTEIHLPSGIVSCYGCLPSQILKLYPNSTQYYYGNYFFRYMNSNLEIIVPESQYNSYLSAFQTLCNDDYYGYTCNAYSHITYIRENPNTYTITVNTPGTLLQEYFNVASQWGDVDTLIVIGSLNNTDMYCFRKMSNLGKLDLQQTNITTIKGCNGLKRLKTVLLPSSVTSIGDSAFMNCTSLETITNTNAVTTLGDYALTNCLNLTSYPTQNVQSVGLYALSGMNITGGKLTFPELTTMSAYSFAGLSVDTLDLPKLSYVPNNAFRNSSSGSYSYIQHLLIPMATSIGTYAFYYNDYITSVYMPLVNTVGQYAFYGCDNISYVDIPAATTVGSYAFYQCTSLDSVNLPVANSISTYTFYGCTSLKKVNIPYASTINTYAFYGCTSLSKVNMSYAQYIYYYAFYNCPIDTLYLSSYIRQLGGTSSDNDNNYPVFSTNRLTHVFCYAPIPIETYVFSSVSATLHVPAFALNSYRMHDSWSTFPIIVPIDTLCEDLIIRDSYTLSSLHGLVENPGIYVWKNGGNLTINTDTIVNLSEFYQSLYSPDLAKYYLNYGYDASNVDSWYFSQTMVNDTVTAGWVYQDVLMRLGYWNFVSFPFDVDVASIVVPENTNWVIRRYSGQDRANLTGNSWQNMDSTMTLNANEGYIIHCQNGDYSTSITFRFFAKQNANKNKIFSMGDVTVPLNKFASAKAINSNWNMVGNPYPCFMNSSAIQHNGIITIWDGYDYAAISLVDDNYTLMPNEAFFVQCPNNASSMTFQTSGRSMRYTPSQIFSAPSDFINDEDNSRKVYNLTLSVDTLSDHTRFVINPSASVDYELSCDASKFAGSSAAKPEFYMVENEEHLAINERPMASGIFNLGYKAKVAGNYTITLESNPDATTRPYIIDVTTGEKTCLDNSSFTFYTAVGTFDKRFIITFDEVPAGVDNAEGSTDFITEGDVFAMDGRFVMHFENRTQLDNLAAGTFILRSGNTTEKFIKK